VTNVDDQLHVLNPAVPYVYAAYLDPFTPYVAAWYVGSSQPLESDSKIQDRINAEFSWSPFVYPQDVHVAVAKGKVTLTGTVQSFVERSAAVQSAFEAGAISVDDELKVS
jgi:hypothetical protein